MSTHDQSSRGHDTGPEYACNIGKAATANQWDGRNENMAATFPWTTPAMRCHLPGGAGGRRVKLFSRLHSIPGKAEIFIYYSENLKSLTIDFVVTAHGQAVLIPQPRKTLPATPVNATME